MLFRALRAPFGGPIPCGVPPASIILTPITLTRGRRFELIALFGLLTLFTPIAVDLYMPAFPAMAREFGTPVSAVEHSLAAYFLGMAVGQAAI